MATLKSILANSQYGLTLLSDVESIWGRQIDLRHDPNLKGLYFVDLNSAVVFHRDINPTADGCVHELSHLKLVKLGCPKVVLTRQYESNVWVRDISHFLSDLFEHQLFFPELVANGFSPYSDEEKGLASQLDQIVAKNIHLKTPLNSGSNKSLDPELAFLAIVYARAFLECKSSKLQEKCNITFSTPYLTKSRQIGEELTNIVRSHALLDFEQVRMGLRKSLELLCLTDNLRINGVT